MGRRTLPRRRGRWWERGTEREEGLVVAVVVEEGVGPEPGPLVEVDEEPEQRPLVEEVVEEEPGRRARRMV